MPPAAAPSGDDPLPSVNRVTSALSSKTALLQHVPASASGPHHLFLPLARDRAKIAFTLERVLSPTECERLVRAAEAEGFGAAGLGRAGEQTVATELRNSSRLIVEDPLLACQIFERVRPYLPTVFGGRRILGLNEQLKFLRYGPGQKFVAHYDGAFCRPNTANRTCITVQLYLSQGEVVGGSTRFMAAHGEPALSCSPEAGRALIFQHNILHDGEEVQEGVKYTIRTDVEYSGRTCLARLQEVLGLGGSPIEQKRRCMLALPLVAVACSLLLSRFF